LLFAGLVSIGMGQSLMFAILPPVARNLGLSEVQVGIIFAVSGVLWVLTSPFWGRRSDVWGRRPVILIGLLGYAVSMTLLGIVVQASLAGWLALFPAYVLMIATRAIFGALGSATAPAANAYVADRTEPKERVAQLALQGAGFGLGFTLGPGVASLLLIFGLLTPFYAIALFAFVSAIVIGLRLPEQAPRRRPAQEDRPEGSEKRVSPLDPRVSAYMAVGIALGIGQATAMQTAGFYAIDVLGMTIEQSARLVGFALMGTAAAGLFVQLVVIRLWKPLPRSMMGVGSAFGAAGFLILVFANNYPTLLTAMIVLGFSFGLVRPGTTAGASLAVGRDEQGAVAGLMNTTGALGSVFAPVVGMSLYQLMPRAPYVLDLLLMLFALALIIWHPQLRDRR
jgi:MFS family permease